MKRVLVVVSMLCTNSDILTKAIPESSSLMPLGVIHRTVLNRPRTLPRAHRQRQVETANTHTAQPTANNHRTHVSQRYTLPDHVFLNQE